MNGYRGRNLWKTLPLLIGLVLCSSGLLMGDQIPTQGKVIFPKGLNLRAGPGLQHPVLLVMPYGTVVQILGIRGKWYEVDIGSKRGFCRIRWIEETSFVPAKDEDASKRPHYTLKHTDHLSQPTYGIIDQKILKNSPDDFK